MQSTESDLNNLLMNMRTNNSFGCSVWRLVVLTSLLLMLTATAVTAQGFELAFGGPKEDQGVAIVETEDHGFLEVGFSEGVLGDDNDIDIYIVRTDVDGTTLWERRYDEGFEEFPTEIIATSDRGFLISGHRKEGPDSSSRAYLLKIDEFGDILWQQTYEIESGAEMANHILATDDGNYLLTGTFTDAITNRQDVMLRKVDENGEEIWRQLVGSNRDEEGIGAVKRNGGYVIGANGQTSLTFDDDIMLYGVDELGNLQWLRVYGEPMVGEQIDDIIPTSDGNLVFVGSVNNFNTALIAKANLNGDTLWYKEVNATPFDNLLHGVIEEEGGVLVAAGEAVPSAAQLNIDILMVKVNSADGQLIYQRLIGDDNVLNTAADLAPTVKGGYAIAAFNALANISFNDMTLFKTDSAGTHLTNHLRGRVFYSDDGCNPYTPGDRGLAGWLVRAESDDAIFFGSTDSLGFYDLQVDIGTYTVELLQKNNRWAICNPVALIVDFEETYDSTRHDFSLTPDLDCPLLEVEMSAGPAMACDIQTLTVTYGNQGTVIADEVVVTLELDEILAYTSSTIPVDNQDGQTLTFSLPDLAPGDQGSFSVNVAIGCAGVINQQAVSSTVTINTPNENCAPVNPEWDGSSIEVSSICTDTAVVFSIKNTGNNDMTRPLRYVVIEDIILVRERDFSLISQETELVEIPLDEGAITPTYRLIAEQPEGHPGDLFPTAVVEGCGTSGDFTVGRVAQFPDNDGDLNIDILTQEVFVAEASEILALRAYPKGYQDSIVTPDTDLEYTVFFSLAGENDTIGRVVIRDTLSSLLDLNSLEMGSASHPYDFTLYQNGVLKITFDSIQLHAGGGTGGADNSSQHQGYVTYRLSQKPNNAVGDVISNRAAVYFDYRSPAISNEVRHYVSCQELFASNCLLTNSVNYPEFSGVNISVFPNPVQTQTTVRVSGWENERTEFEFHLYDLMGRRVEKRAFTGNQLQISGLNLPAATYFYELWGDGYPIGKGKLFVQ